MPDKVKNNKITKKWHQHWWGISILFVFAIIVIFFAAFLHQVVTLIVAATEAKYSTANYDFNTIQNLGSYLNVKDMVETKDDPYFGPEDADLVIVEFVDYQCPFCKEEYPTIQKIREEYKDRVKFIFRDFPNIPNHPQALEAAIASECATDQDKFMQYHDKLFENQNNLLTENLKLLAFQAGMDLNKFSSCVDSKKYENEVKNDMEEGLKLQISGTPTFFINGNRVPGVIPYNTFKQIIENILAGQKNPKSQQ